MELRQKSTFLIPLAGVVGSKTLPQSSGFYILLWSFILILFPGQQRWRVITAPRCSKGRNYESHQKPENQTVEQ